MKNIIIAFLLSLFLATANAQVFKTKLDFVGGISAREYIHGGLRYQYTDITQLGFYYGGDLGINTAIIRTYCIDNMIHFGKESFITNRPVWYARQGFTYSSNTETSQTYKYSYVNISAGREFGINDWLGVNFDMGVILQLMEKTVYENPAYADRYRNTWFWLPLVRAQIFISL